MKRRLYFTLPDVRTARQAVDELLLARIEARHMHVLAKEGTGLEGLPEANVLQTSDFVHGLELGLIVGGATGVVAGAAAMLVQPLGLATGGALVLAVALAGAAIGAWVSSMIGSSVPNTRLRAFEKDLEAGRILLMVDVPPERVEEVQRLIKKHHPEAGDHGREPTIPAFP